VKQDVDEKKQTPLAVLTMEMYEEGCNINFTWDEVTPWRICEALWLSFWDIIAKPEWLPLEARQAMFDMTIKVALNRVMELLQKDEDKETFVKQFVNNLVGMWDFCYEFLEKLWNNNNEW